MGVIVMWLVTDTGFLSVVSYDPKKDTKNKRSNRQIKSWGANPVLIRARLAGDIEQVRPYYSKLKIEKDTSADYEFRAIVPRKRWVEFVAAKAEAIDYTAHFKEVAEKRSPGGKAEGAKRHGAMMTFWSAFAKLQPDAPYGGLYSNKCWSSIESEKDGKKYRVYCSKKAGHTSSKTEADRAHEYSEWSNYSYSQYSPPASYGTSSAYTQAYSPDGYNGQVADYLKLPTDTVIGMARALIEKGPANINVDSATPRAAYNLFVDADEAYSAPMEPAEVIALLDRIVNDDTVHAKDMPEYEEALAELTDEVLTTTAE